MASDDLYDFGDDDTAAVLDKETLLSYLAEVVATKAGRVVLWEILSYCKLGDSLSYPDTNTAYISSGRRDVGLEILGLLEQLDYRLYPKLILEMNDNATRTKS